MSGVTSGAATSGPSVRLVSPYAGVTGRRVTGARTTSTNTRRLSAWIVRSIMVATTGFALLDLFLLASGGHH